MDDHDVVANATLSAGSQGDADVVCVSEGCYLLEVSEGDWPNEVSWTVNRNFTGLTGGAPYGPAYLRAEGDGNLALAYGCAPSSAPTVTVVGNCRGVDCADTDNGAADPYGDGCDEYASNPSWCGNYDDADFSSNEMCCVCGGGCYGDCDDGDSANDHTLQGNEFENFIHILGNGEDRLFTVTGATGFSISNVVLAYGSAYDGGAVHIGPGTEQFTATQSMFVSNLAANQGGAIYHSGIITKPDGACRKQCAKCVKLSIHPVAP